MKRIMRTVVLVLVLLTILGITSAIAASEEKKALEEGVTDFNYMTPAEFKSGHFTAGFVYEVYGEFAYNESYSETLGIKHGSKVTAHYYIIPMMGTFDAESPLFIALELKSDEAVKNAELLMEQTWNYLEDGSEPEVWNEFLVHGKIRPLSGELEDYLYDWLTSGGTDGTRADYEDMICPFMISERPSEAVDRDMTLSIVMCAIGLGGAAVILIIFIRSRTAPVTAPPEASYNPVSSAPMQSDSLRSASSGNVSTPADGGETARLMEEMNKLSQPADADDFFSDTKGTGYPASPKTDMSGTDTSELGAGIADDDK